MYISGTVARHWRYKDKCKWHCLQGVSDLAKDTDVYIIYWNVSSTLVVWMKSHTGTEIGTLRISLG